MRGYVAGPMAGYEDFNYRAFYGAEAALDLAGWDVVNPARLDVDDGIDVDDTPGVDGEALTVSPLARAGFLRRDIRALAECDAIFMLPGWEDSTGANAELLVATVMGLDVYVLERESAWWGWRRAPMLSPLWTKVRQHTLDVAADRAGAWAAVTG